MKRYFIRIYLWIFVFIYYKLSRGISVVVAAEAVFNFFFLRMGMWYGSFSLWFFLIHSFMYDCVWVSVASHGKHSTPLCGFFELKFNAVECLFELNLVLRWIMRWHQFSLNATHEVENHSVGCNEIIICICIIPIWVMRIKLFYSYLYSERENEIRKDRRERVCVWERKRKREKNTDSFCWYMLL